MCLSSGKNTWLKEELGTLNGDGVQAEATGSAVHPGSGLRRHLSDLQIYFENWPDAHTLGDVIHITNRGKKPVIPVWEKSSFLYINGINLPVREVPNTRNQVFFTRSYSNGPISAFKAYWII